MLSKFFIDFEPISAVNAINVKEAMSNKCQTEDLLRWVIYFATRWNPSSLLILILFSFWFHTPWYIAKFDGVYKHLICAGWVVVHYYKNLATGSIWSCYKLLKIYILQNSICTDCWPTFNEYIYSVCNKNDFQYMNNYIQCIYSNYIS